MKILFFITGLTRSGAETQMFNLILGLVKKKNIKIKVISLIGGDYKKELENLGVKVGVFSDTPKKNIFNYISFFKKEVKKFKPDIVHSFLFHTNIVAKLSLFFMEKKFKLVCGYRSLIKKYPLIMLLEYFNMWKVDILIPNSERGNKDLDVYKIFKPIRKVIYNGFVKNIINKKNVLRLKKKFKKKKIILTVANIRPEKDFTTNILACKELSKKRDDFLFLYVGEGKNNKKIKKLIKELKIDNKIKFLGNRNDVLELLKISDVFFLPTLYESQSNSLMEAMHMKVPIVTTDLAENRELVQYGEFCAIGDYKTMAKKINMILENGFNENKLSKNYNFINKKISFNKMVKEYYKIYGGLLNVWN